MPDSNDQPRLRLVGVSTDPAAEPSARPKPEPAPARMRAGQALAARLIDAENRAAVNPDINPADPRWVLAARAHSQLDGAALAPDKRDKLMKLAQQLGIRPFDAAVIVALVQDRARRGRSLHDITTTLQMIPLREVSTGSHVLWRWGAAIICALVGAALLIQWVLAG